MTANQLRNEIEQSLRTLWPGFAAQHPRLAALLDPGSVLDAAADHFADNPDYQHALADAVALRAASEDVQELIRQLTMRWLRSVC